MLTRHWLWFLAMFVACSADRLPSTESPAPDAAQPSDPSWGLGGTNETPGIGTATTPDLADAGDTVASTDVLANTSPDGSVDAAGANGLDAGGAGTSDAGGAGTSDAGGAGTSDAGSPGADVLDAGAPDPDAGPPDAPDTGPPDVATCIDGDGDGHGDGCAAGPDCDDADPTLWEGCLDCAKIFVEGCPCDAPGQQVICTSGDPDLLNTGQCKAGKRACLGGVWTGCLGETLPAPEACNDLDDDCDGAADEGLPGCGDAPACVDTDGDGYGTDCLLGDDCDDANPSFTTTCPDCSKGELPGCPCTAVGKTIPCSTGGPVLVGACKKGQRICSGGFWTECLNEILPQPETCNEVDDDCDGETDEGVPGCEIVPPCTDADGDGYGADCPLGPDCDDSNPSFTAECPDCTQFNYPGCPCANLGQQKPCYSGDAGLIGIGQCAAGVRTCSGGGWTGCEGEVLKGPELCDGTDNDCDGGVDEGVLGECGDCNPLCFAETAGASGAAPFDPTPQNSSQGVILTPEGWLTLSESSYSMHFIWISNSAESTVSKLDTLTGKELGRYSFCSDPSRTAVDPSGDGWVACRGDGIVAKIRNIPEECPDKDGDGVIETSTDTNGDGIIQANEMMPKGTDECVLFATNPANDSLARALGIDSAHHAWVGYWNSKALRRIHPDDGSIVDTIALPANPYGLVIDSKGIVWVSGRGGSVLVRVDPATHGTQTYKPGGCFEPYGIAVDEWDRIWIANCCCADVAYVFNPAGGGWSSVPTQGRPRGIASNKDGYVFVANDLTNAVARIDSNTFKNTGYAQLGGGRFPLGVAVDSEGFVWAVNQGASSATKINPDSLQLELEHPVGTGPYTYSDMTGSSFFQDVVPKGTYRLTYEGPTLDAYLAEWYEVVWETLTVEASTPGGTSIQVRARAANSKAALPGAAWSAMAGPFPPKSFPLDLDALLGPAAHGKIYLELELTLNASGLIKPYVKNLALQYSAKQKP